MNENKHKSTLSGGWKSTDSVWSWLWFCFLMKCSFMEIMGTKTVHVLVEVFWLDKALETMLKQGSFFNLNTINIIIILNVYVYLLFPRCFTCFWYISLILLVYHSCVGSSGYFEDYFGLILGVCDERCWCVHKYRCYYWNINNCLLEIIGRPRSKMLVDVMSQNTFILVTNQHAWCSKSNKPHPSGVPGSLNQTAPKWAHM